MIYTKCIQNLDRIQSKHRKNSKYNSEKIIQNFEIISARFRKKLEKVQKPIRDDSGRILKKIEENYYKIVRKFT